MMNQQEQTASVGAVVDERTASQASLVFQTEEQHIKKGEDIKTDIVASVVEEQTGAFGMIKDTTQAAFDAGMANVKKARNVWNYWGCWLCTYIAFPIVLVATFFGASASQQIVSVRNISEPIIPGTCQDIIVFSSLSRAWKVYLSLVPIALVVWGVLLMNKSSQIVAPLTLIVTCVLCVLYFSDEGSSTAEDTILASGLILMTVVDRVLWTVFEYAYNVFAAFFFLRILQLWGVVGLMKDEFEVLAYDPERKILLIMFNFAVMLAVVAPGGSNFLIAGSILVEMNIMNLPVGKEKDKYDMRIGILVLFGNALTSAYNLVGVCIVALAGDIIGIIDEKNANFPCAIADEKCAQKQIGLQYTAQFFFLSFVSPTLMVWIFTRNIFTSHFLRRDLILCLGCGFIFALVQVLTATYIGPELPCLTSAGASTIFYLLYVHFEPNRFRRGSVIDAEQLEAQNRAKSKTLYQRIMWMFPFLLLTFLLMLTNLFPAVVFAFEGGSDPIAQQALDVFLLSVRTRCKTFISRWPWFIHSGTMVLYSAIFTPFLVKFTDAEENVKLLALIDFDTAGMMNGSTNKVGDEIITPGEAKLKRAAEINKDAMKDLLGLYRQQDSFLYRYKVILRRAFIDALSEALPVTIAIASFASLARIMSGFGMTTVLSRAIVDGISATPLAYGLVAPIIGAIGSSLTGSTTTSNFLFGRLQVQTAFDLGLVQGAPNRFGSIWAVAGAQVLGSSAGELIAPQNAVFSVLVLGGRFRDGDFIRGLLPFTFSIWLGICMLCGFIAVSLIPYA